MIRPEATEYDAYFERYASLVPDGDIGRTLAHQLDDTIALLESVPPQRETWSYEAGKWSLRDVVGHVADTERVFAGRALWIARDPLTPQPGMDQDVWASNSPAGGRPLGDLLEEWRTVRAGTLSLLRSLDEASLARTGTASGKPVTVRALFWLIAGHELHHRRILAEKYGLQRAGG